jgi:hypothetical protein
MSWWRIVKRDYTGQLDGFFQTMGSLKEQVKDAQTMGLEMDYGRDFCCENAMARVVDILEMTGKLITSTGAALTGKEAADHVSEYNCDKLRVFIEETLLRGKLTPEINEEYQQILDDWKDCEGE